MNNFQAPDGFAITILLRCLNCNYTFIWTGSQVKICKSCGHPNPVTGRTRGYTR